MVIKTVVEAQDIFDKAWEGFKGVDWKEKASISRFVQANYTPYDGDESFLAGPTERSLHIKKIVEESNVDLLETLALDIIKEIKKLNENIEDVQVNIRKLAVPINGIFDSVEIQIKD